ncbi:MAG: alpha-1,2-fucosyltransferase [Synergistaceae bacterium]|jgi:hypothetical protein|nr:alpha-1,2-fucosyltransferase [Synergistaceae bacterium]
MDDMLRFSFRRFIAPALRKPLITSRGDFKPEIVVRMDGPLGMQMWQYSIGRAAGIASELPVLYDLRSFGKNVCELEDSFPDILLWKAPDDLAARYSLFFYTGDPGERNADGKDFFASKSPRYLGGSYLDAIYVDPQGDELRDEFTFKPVLSEVKRSVFSSVYLAEFPVAVHLAPGLVSGSFFRAAIRNVSERVSPGKATFFVFSKSYADNRMILEDLDGEFVYVETNENRADDMYLMSRCRHFIISNSLFGWWSAWLSRHHADKIVVMPDKWSPQEPQNEALAMALDEWTVLRAD